MINLVKRSVPFETASIIADNVRSVLAVPKTGLLSFGAIASIWSASSALNSIMASVLDRSYEVTEDRSFLRSRAVAIALTFMMIPAKVVSLLLPVFGEKIETSYFFIYGVIVGILTLWNIAMRVSASAS